MRRPAKFSWAPIPIWSITTFVANFWTLFDDPRPSAKFDALIANSALDAAKAM
jgi:hypothetical protein